VPSAYKSPIPLAPELLEDMPSSKKHHNRTYSWPPTLHLIDVSALGSPIPDIDDDPFAHFISIPVEDDELAADMLSFSAGIIAPPSSASRGTKAYKFRTSIAKKWARYIAKHYSILHHRHHIVASIEKHTKELPITESKLPPFRHDSIPDATHELLSESHARRLDKKPSRTHHQIRHSWHAPPADLFTIKEEEGEEEGGYYRNSPKEVEANYQG
jgi:hypothetical protein